MKNAHYHNEECYISESLKSKTKAKITFGLIQGIIANRVQFSRVRMDRFCRRQASLLNAIFCRIVILCSSETVPGMQLEGLNG